MTAGISLDDADRRPWLKALSRAVIERIIPGNNVIVTCSALRKAYRGVFRGAVKACNNKKYEDVKLYFVFLKISEQGAKDLVEIRRRVSRRVSQRF
jgi:gluconate kinase